MVPVVADAANPAPAAASISWNELDVSNIIVFRASMKE
jgi:hypothetical protein